MIWSWRVGPKVPIRQWFGFPSRGGSQSFRNVKIEHSQCDALDAKLLVQLCYGVPPLEIGGVDFQLFVDFGFSHLIEGLWREGACEDNILPRLLRPKIVIRAFGAYHKSDPVGKLEHFDDGQFK